MKHVLGQKIHSHFQDHSDMRRMLPCIQSITNNTASPACDSDISLPDSLNNIYAGSDTQNASTVRKTILAQVELKRSAKSSVLSQPKLISPESLKASENWETFRALSIHLLHTGVHWYTVQESDRKCRRWIFP